MNRHARNGHGDGGDGDGDGDWPQGRHWACPFYLSNPIRHEACVAYKLGRVPDVRQHIERKHAEEAGEKAMEKMKGKNDRGKTNVERWYALWTLLFPGLVQPVSPYSTGTGIADVAVDFVSRFMEGWEMDGRSEDGKTALTECVAFVKYTSREMKSGRMPFQPRAVANVSERQPQDTVIQNSNTQDNATHQGLPLLPNQPDPMITSQPQQSGPRGFFPGYYDPQAPIVPTQVQAPSLPIANNQYWPRLTGPAAYPAVSTHHLPPVQSFYAAAANGLGDYAINPSNLSSAINWASTGGFDCGDDEFQFGGED
ncbi:hypothetical protein F5144DRAFT_598996 [Chaetomium tenue]|uniref:Uncharacterized protein n=1 Tax=Chaetomium tenue TaxID=1854479 RepID=A0ACB7PGU8_9PEZI|nr:hypothetical protein F5144DRAFT_598996 [Chaetomium globosum]